MLAALLLDYCTFLISLLYEISEHRRLKFLTRKQKKQQKSLVPNGTPCKNQTVEN